MAAWSTRSATPADIPAVLALWQDAGAAESVTDTPLGLTALIAREREGILIAEEGGAAIGSLIAVWDGWRGSFYKLAVHPRRRREGIASALLREGERRLRERGAERLTAIVSVDDPVALAFWRAAGYSPQQERTRFVRHVSA
ncbi:MAG TPA: GNAT family N-acetyltransferase [Solirubrobacteraceae bacterium]|nr:GNAT family N-acetyltransferase [Solirubrobacteraceae bacterium]